MKRPKEQKNLVYNYAYYPVVFKTEKILLRVKSALEEEKIFIRRYFYPSLNKLPYLSGNYEQCPVSEEISSRIACLPLYTGLQDDEIEKITDIIKRIID